MASGDARGIADWPEATLEEKIQRHAATLPELAKSVPDGVRLGFHWCYGTWGGWPMKDMADLGLCVRMTEEAIARIDRRVDYVHMPALKHPEPKFFAPLAELDEQDINVYLGIIHHTDGVEGFRERMEMARRYRDTFGIGSVCGYGRVDPAELPQHPGHPSRLRRGAARRDGLGVFGDGTRFLKAPGPPAEQASPEVRHRVESMLEEIERGGIDAVRRFSRELDGWDPETFVATEEDFERASASSTTGSRSTSPSPRQQVAVLRPRAAGHAARPRGRDAAGRRPRPPAHPGRLRSAPTSPAGAIRCSPRRS